MAKFGNAFMALFLDKKAREHRERTGNKGQQPTTPDVNFAKQEPLPQSPSPESIRQRLEDAEQEMEKKRSPQRLELIKNAMRIRNEQAKLLDQLSNEQKQKLQSIAVQSFLNGGKD